MRWPSVWDDTRLDDGGSALTQHLVRVLCFFAGYGTLLKGIFAEHRPDAGPTFQMLARHWPGLGETLELAISFSLYVYT